MKHKYELHKIVTAGSCSEDALNKISDHEVTAEVTSVTFFFDNGNGNALSFSMGNVGW